MTDKTPLTDAELDLSIKWVDHVLATAQLEAWDKISRALTELKALRSALVPGKDMEERARAFLGIPAEHTFVEVIRRDVSVALLARELQSVRQAEREACAKEVPTSWLDSLMTPLCKLKTITGKDVEGLCQRIAVAVRSRKD